MTWLKCYLALAARSLTIMLLTLLIVGAAGLTILRTSGRQLLTVQTGSMVPVFCAGDALIVQPVSPRQLQVGEVISYRSLLDAQLIISHRLVRIDSRSGLLTTKGDALHTSDPPFSSSRVIGRPILVAPGLGRVLNLMRHPLALAITLYLPAVSVIIGEVRRLARHFQQPRYQFFGYSGCG